MNKQTRNKLACGILASVMALASVCPAGTAYAAGASAAEWQQDVSYKGSNIGTQSYSKWSKPVNSYLVPCSSGRLMRVQYAPSIDGILAEYYSASYQFESSRIIPKELPIFGGFYETGQYYFLLTGQNNMGKSPDVEVFQITKYDKNWNRIGSVGISDCDVKTPFDASAARMDTYKNYLVIRTGRTMYNGHQSNITFQLDMDTMQITDAYTDWSDINAGYVSHSFNQFLKVEDGHIIAIDHGDTYPRSIVLIKYNKDLSDGRFQGRCSNADIIKFAGNPGTNATGGSAGGFEISDSSYLIAGNSVVQDEISLSRKTRNVFVAAADKNNISQVAVNWLTNYSEGEETASTPHMLKISGDSYAILWSRNDSVYYTTVDGSGKQTGKTYEMQGKLSDCVPTISDGKIIWYTWENENIVFYEINTRNLSETKSKTIRNGKKTDSSPGNRQEDTASSSTQATPSPGSSSTAAPGTTHPTDNGTQATPSTTPSSQNENENKQSTSTKEYMVTFHANGGSVGGYSFIDIQTSGQKLSYFPEPYKNGYTFEGWYTKADGGTKASLSAKYEANQTLYAHWKDNSAKKEDTASEEYKITFNPEGGTVIGNTSAYTVGNRLKEFPKASRDGYEFVCWRTWEGKPVSTSSIFVQNTEVYAQWRKLKTILENSGSKTGNEYTITFHANGGVMDGPSAVTTVNQKLPSLPNASKEGYTLLGWYNLEQSRIPADTSWTFYADFDLYAYWLPNNASATDTVKTDTGSKTNTETNTETDVSPSAGSDAETDTGSDSKTETDKKIGIGISIKPDTGTDTGTSTGQNKKTDSCTGTDAKTDTDTGAKTGTVTDTEPSISTDAKTDTKNKETVTGTDTDTGAKPDTDTDAKPGVAPEPKSDADKGTTVPGISTVANVKKAKIKSAKSPAAGKLKVKWKPFDASNGFQISCSRSRSFPAKKTTVKKAKVTNTSITISGLSKGKNYYVKIRAYKKVNGRIYYGKWSSVRKVKIKK